MPYKVGGSVLLSVLAFELYGFQSVFKKSFCVLFYKYFDLIIVQRNIQKYLVLPFQIALFKNLEHDQ